MALIPQNEAIWASCWTVQKIYFEKWWTLKLEMFWVSDLLNQSFVWLFQCFQLFAGKFYFKLTNVLWGISVNCWRKAVFCCVTNHTAWEDIWSAVLLFGCEMDDVMGDSSLASHGVLFVGLRVVFTVLFQTNQSSLSVLSLNTPCFGCQPFLAKW
jgi:hypothetical protein